MTDADTTDTVLRAYEITGPYRYLTYDDGIWNYGDCLDLTDAMAADLLTCHFVRRLNAEGCEMTTVGNKTTVMGPRYYNTTGGGQLQACSDLLSEGPDTLSVLAEAVIKVGEK